LWCGWGMGSAELDGVMIFSPAGKPIGRIALPERSANLCFGGPKRNRLFMAASHSVYALYVNTQGALGGEIAGSISTCPGRNAARSAALLHRDPGCSLRKGRNRGPGAAVQRCATLALQRIRDTSGGSKTYVSKNYEAARRTASATMRMEKPAIRRLMPTRSPITHIEVPGRPAMMMKASTMSMMPLRRSQNHA